MRNLVQFIILCVLAETAFAANQTVKGSSVDKLTAIDLKDVKVEGEIGRRIDLMINKNLLALDVDKDFLKQFQEKKNEGTWEYIALGKLIDSTVHFAAYSKDEKVLALKKHLIDQAIASQDPNGYIGIFVPGKRLSNLWDIHENAYLILGLVDDYRCFGNKKSLEAATKMVDYIIKNWSNAHPTLISKVGLEYAVMQLYKETGGQKYLDFACKVRNIPQWNTPIKLIEPSTDDANGDGIDGHHAYMYMDVCRAQLQLYQFKPDEKLLKQSRNVIDFLTKENGLFVTGSCNTRELWSIDQNGSDRCEETCATAYLIRLLDNMLELENKSLYGDMMERTIYNALFAAQAADGRKLRYFTAFEGPRVYFEPDTSCCPGNFRRIVSELPALVYYKSDKGLTINLYAQSSAKIKLAGGQDLEIKQVTDYPNSGKVIIEISPSKSAKFPLSLRIPRWCKKADISINGAAVKEKITPSTFFTINRKWQAGDKVELNMPMEWRLVKGRVANTMKVAVMRGPMLFCINPTLNKALTDLGPNALIGLNLDTFKDPINDQTVRPEGLGCKVSTWAKNQQGQPTSIELLFTEFADPAGEMTYVPMQGMYFVSKYYGDPSVKNVNMLVDDELVESK